MALLSQHLKFVYPWRTYQHRFLTDFDVHLKDDHLHVVAPPGSGKTVLGLEMLRRLDKKALILAPTLPIRNQWHERLEECFLSEKDSVSTSFNLKKPATLTFSTYQSLHAFFKIDLEFSSEKLIAFFKESGIETLVFDEAHHLKKEWWKPLFKLKEISFCTIISLTATPPYDSENVELKKYFDLCGPIDMEIGVPELVREINLCPHQDYIYFSEPDEAQIQYILAYREQLMFFVNALKENKEFINFVLKHPLYEATEENLEAIYSKPERYSSLLIYLHAAGITIDKYKLEVLGIDTKKAKFPSLTYSWVEALLDPFLFEERDNYVEEEPLLSSIEKELRKIGAIELNRINLQGEKGLYRRLSQNPSKLNSIVEIVQHESEQLKSKLRMVVLSDYIRKEFLEVTYTDSISDINKLGVVPIFQYIRSFINTDSSFPLKKENLAALSGSVIILHNSVITELSKEIPPTQFTQEILWETEYILIKPKAAIRKKMVGAMTLLFEKGTIQVLVGTKSLLGEGWDAPVMNSLILASFVGSFVMSNQMRGRAIRIDSKEADKVANIWHLACLDPTSETGGADMEVLSRRFEAFCGVSLEGKPYIENGVDRLLLSQNMSEVSNLNATMLENSSRRSVVAKRWNEAIDKGTVLVHELKLKYSKSDATPTLKKLYFRDALAYVLAELSMLFSVALPELFFKNLTALLSKGFLFFIYALLLGFAMILLPKTVKAVFLYVKFGRRDKDLRAIALALKDTMIATKFLVEKSDITT